MSSLCIFFKVVPQNKALCFLLLIVTEQGFVQIVTTYLSAVQGWGTVP